MTAIRGGHVGLREEKKAEQRRAILATAVGLFRERGFAATRVGDIAERLRISEATFFNYFPSKQTVLEAVAADLIDRAFAQLHHEAADDSRPVTTRIEGLVQTFAGEFAGDREFAALLALNTQLGLVRSRQRESFRLLTGLFAEGQRRGEIRADVPAGQLSELFMATTIVTLSNWLLAPDDDEDGEGPLDEALVSGDLAERLLRAWQILWSGVVCVAPLRA
ncbi:MAG TPA: TetR/AcrR family transcriptional regulator [Acidimicrobiia bacterium]|nr:TetR/AcrR family transcriptional regulator [Acidimicrobiia bacterium]